MTNRRRKRKGGKSVEKLWMNNIILERRLDKIENIEYNPANIFKHLFLIYVN